MEIGHTTDRHMKFDSSCFLKNAQHEGHFRQAGTNIISANFGPGGPCNSGPDGPVLAPDANFYLTHPFLDLVSARSSSWQTAHARVGGVV